VSFKIKMGLGVGTNNFAKLMSLKLLLLFTKEKNVNSIHVFGDSQMVIKWVQNLQQCHNILLQPILEEVHKVVATFDIHHVYRERSITRDHLSKAELHLQRDQWLICEENNDTFYEYYHRPFVDHLH